MAIGTPVHVTQLASATTSVTTGSFTPAAASIIFAWASARHASATPADHTISDSLGLTWTKVDAVTGPLTNAFMKGTLFWAASTNTSMTVTATTATTGAVVAVEIVTIPMGTPNTSVRVGVGDANGDPSATLPGTPAAAIAFATAQTGNQFTQNNAYTEIVDANPTGLTNQLHNCVAYDLTSPSATCGMTSTNVNTVMLLLSLVEATGGYTLTASAGSGTIAGTAAGLRAARQTSAASGAIIATGTAAGLRAARKADANAGAISVAGTNAALVYGANTAFSIAAASGAFAWSGSAASLRIGRRAPANSGSVAVTGVAAALRAGRALPLASGAVSATGAAAVLKRGLRIAADPGTLDAAGVASLLAARRLDLAAGSFAIAGEDVIFAIGGGAYSLSCLAGDFALTGEQVDLVYVAHRPRQPTATRQGVASAARPQLPMVTRPAQPSGARDNNQIGVRRPISRQEQRWRSS